jgi:hypothetical protein
LSLSSRTTFRLFARSESFPLRGGHYSRRCFRQARARRSEVFCGCEAGRTVVWWRVGARPTRFDFASLVGVIEAATARAVRLGIGRDHRTPGCDRCQRRAFGRARSRCRVASQNELFRARNRPWKFLLAFDFNHERDLDPISLDWLGPTQQDGAVQYRRNAGTGVRGSTRSRRSQIVSPMPHRHARTLR